MERFLIHLGGRARGQSLAKCNNFSFPLSNLHGLMGITANSNFYNEIGSVDLSDQEPLILKLASFFRITTGPVGHQALGSFCKEAHDNPT